MEAYICVPRCVPVEGRQAHDRALGRQQLTRMARDRVQHLGQLATLRELQRDLVQRLPLALPAIQVGDRQAQLHRSRNLARDV